MNNPIVCLLIDDDTEDQEIFMMALKNLDHDVKCIMEKNAINALNSLKSGLVSPDFIFVDLNLPLMNGKEFIVEMRKLVDFDAVQLVAYSSSSHEKHNSLRLGATHFFSKPTTIPLLEEALNGIFNEYSPDHRG